MAPIGGAEMLLKAGTGALASLPAGLTYMGGAIGKALGADVNPSQLQSKVQNYLTYQPMSASGQAGERALGDLARPIVAPIAQRADQAATVVGRVSPFAESMMREAPSAFQAVSGVMPIASGLRSAMTAPFRPTGPVPSFALKPAATAEDIVSRMDTSQSMGAAAAAPRLTEVSPELRQAIVTTAQKTGGAINPDVLARHIDADTLPVRGRLSEGQATGDAVLISQEQNLRGQVPQYGELFNEQNRVSAQNLQAIRDEVGPEVFSTNHVEHGDTLINAYKALDTAREAQVSRAYKELRDAAGGQFPVGAKTLLTNATQALHKSLLFDHAPPSVMKTLDRLAETPGSMTFENFESLRTNLATIMRTATDGNERRSAGIIRQAMEDLPLVPGAAKLKPLADKARALARARFAAIEADPAYAAAIDGSVPPDRFVQKFVIGGTRDDLAKMRATIGADEAAGQTMGVAVLDHLREQARLSPHYEGNFASASFNKALIKLSPSLQSLLPAKAIDQLEQLGRFVSYTTAQPRGSFVNNSNTFVAAAANKAKGAAEIAGNLAIPGLGAGTYARQRLEGASLRRQADLAMAPGAGLGRLSEPPLKPRGLMQ